MRVFCEYNHNFWEAYFNDIQLTREGLETGLSPGDFLLESEGEEVEEA